MQPLLGLNYHCNMEYSSKYNQPFTLSQAIHLDVSILSEEITRLQNSLQHLRSTQTTLREHTASEQSSNSPVDPEITVALSENEETIGSQEERISILKMALAHKGVSTSNHYDLITKQSQGSEAVIPLPVGPVQNGASDQQDEDDDGIHL